MMKKKDKNKSKSPAVASEIEEFSERSLVQEFGALDERLGKKLDDRGLETSLEVLAGLEEMLDDVDEQLAELEAQHAADIKLDPAATDTIDLAASALALKIVRDGLAERGIYSSSLNRLFSGLQDLYNGASPAGMFLPLGNKSRRPDSGNIQVAKGSIAAIIYAKQKSDKLSRPEAAKWVLKNLSPNLQGRISAQPITLRMLIEWLDRYGGSSGEPGPGRTAFLKHIAEMLNYTDIRPDDCVSFTNGIANKLPALKREKHRQPLS